MKLYWAPRTRSLTSVWLLEEIGAPYQLELVDIRSGGQDTPQYRSINPMGKVPALVDGETVVTEQGAICVYLGDRYPDAGLAPPIGDASRGAYLRWLFFAGNCIEPAYMQKFAGWETVKSQAAWGNYDLVVDVLDKALANAPWIAGKRFTAADAMIGSAVFFGLAFGILDKRDTFTAYAGRCSARPAFLRAKQIEDAAAGTR